MKLENYKFFLFVVVIFYLVIAYKSSGYVQEDEHYQIIEFANYKLGLLPVNKLAWEYKAEIRSGMQPMICFVLFKIFKSFGVTDGYNLAFLLRAVTAIFSIFVIGRFVNAYKHFVASSIEPYFIFASYLLWFLPYINIRFSSESWSGLFLLLTLTAIQKYRNSTQKKQYFIIGLLLALSVTFRYQSMLFVAGILLWYVCIKKTKIQHLLTMVVALVLLMTIGILIDFWLYGQFTLSIYNYFYANLVQGVSSNFGTAPFYEYVFYILTAPGLFGIFIFVSFFVLWYYSPRNLILWAITPFLIIHSAIPHKELRFLFPLANLCPLLVILAYQKLHQNIKLVDLKPLYRKYAGGFLLIFFFIVNTAGLFAIASTGAGKDKTAVTEYIHRNYNEAQTNIIMNGDINPYIDWGTVKNTFYSSSGLHTDRITNIWQTDFLTHKKAGYRNLLIIYNNDITGAQALQFMKRMGLVKVYQNIPNLTMKIYDFYKPSLKDYQILVYEFR